MLAYVKEYVAKHRADALICASFVALLLALLILP